MSPGIGVDWALATNGATAVASSQIINSGWNGPASAAIDGDRIGALWWNPSNDYAGGGGWADNTPGVWPDWLEVDFAGSKTINEIDVFTVQTEANYQSSHIPTPSDTSLNEGLIDYQIQYCPSGITCTNSTTSPYGTGWVDVTVNGADIGHVTNNSNTWRHVVFAPVPTPKIRILANNGRANSSRIVEVEAWDTTAVGTNRALAANGATSAVTSNYSSNFSAGNAIDGDRSAWGYPNGVQAMWCSAQGPSPTSPQVYAVTFAGSANISEIDLFGQQDNKTTAVVPTASLGSTLFAYNDYRIQYCPAGTTCSSATSYPGTGWVDIPGSPAKSILVWNRFNFRPVLTQQIRAVFFSIANSDYARIAELEAWDFSNTTGTNSTDYATAMSLRQEMVGVTGCGAISPAIIGSASGDEQTCNYSWIDWSPTTGAWLLPMSYDSGVYFGGPQSWPSTATTAMTNLGFQSGPYIGADAGSNYTMFQHGILATRSGSTTPHYVGGIPQCLDTQCGSGTPSASCSCNAAVVNGALSSVWFQDTQTNKYPSSDTREYSLGVCTTNAYGERSFLFDSSTDGSGYSTTYIARDNSGFAYQLVGANRAAWESASCATQTALGLPLTNQMPFTLTDGVVATHQEFEGGTIGFAPSQCSSGGGAVSSITTSQHGPATVLTSGAVLCPAEVNTNPCTNGPPIPYTGSDGMTGTYYYHCNGAALAGPGATLGSSWFDGITIVTGAGAEYSVDNDDLGYWLLLGSDQSVASAIAADTPPYFTAPWDISSHFVSGSGSWANMEYYWFDYCLECDTQESCEDNAAKGCLNNVDADYYFQYTTPSGFTSGSNFATTEPAADLHNSSYNHWKVPVAWGDYNCVTATYGSLATGVSPAESSIAGCGWAPSDSTPRQPTRLQLQLTVASSSGTPAGVVFVKLGEDPNSDSPDLGDLTYLDTGKYPTLWLGGATYTFDVQAQGFDNISFITGIRIGNTDTSTPLCINSLTLFVDDDGQMNGGDLCRTDGNATPGCSGGTAGPEEANRILFSKDFVADTGRCASTVNASPYYRSDPNSILISGSEIRTSSAWQYQLQHWNSVINSYTGNGQIYNHFNGFGNTSSLADFLTAYIATALHSGAQPDPTFNLFLYGWIAPGQPMQLSSNTQGNSLHFIQNAQFYTDSSAPSSESGLFGFHAVAGDLVIRTYCYPDGYTGAEIDPENVTIAGFSIPASYLGALPTLPALPPVPGDTSIRLYYSWIPWGPIFDASASSPAFGGSVYGTCDVPCGFQFPKPGGGYWPPIVCPTEVKAY